MPLARYLPDQMGTATLTPAGPFEAGSLAELVLTYTAGAFGIDDGGHLKIAWRGSSDMARPQFTDPKAANYTSVKASNGAVLEARVDRVNIRPWVNTLFIRVSQGFLRAGETITARFGDRRQGSPGLRLQTNCESTFEFKVLVDAFATYEFTEIAPSPEFALVAGPPARWQAIWPTLASNPFRLAVLAEDRWGNPTEQAEAVLRFRPSAPVAGLPEQAVLRRDDGPLVLEGLRAAPGELSLAVEDAAGTVLCRANPLRVVAAPKLRHFWGDLHGQSEETIGTNSVEDYFAYARDRAFVDIVGHQGNDFQMTDAFWGRLNRLTRDYDVPGRFVAVPGYEWSGNTGRGGDRNVFYATEGRPIRRSSSVLVESGTPQASDVHTAAALFEALQGEDAVVIAHAGGRYADLQAAHDGRLERTVEVHSTWGTFEWLLHDAFALGHRVGVACHSDDHKGRPGAAHPSTIGGLTCYLMPELSRPALFAALRARHHYGTTGTRLFLSAEGHFAAPVALFDDDPALGPATARPATRAQMGDIVRPGGQAMRLDVEVVGSAPIERIDIFHGPTLVHRERPEPEATSRRIRVLWQGAEYRGRGREVPWLGALLVANGRFLRAEPVNFRDPEHPLEVVEPGRRLMWQSATTGNGAGIDLWMENGRTEEIVLETHLGGGRFPTAALDAKGVRLDFGGLGRALSLYRMPELLPTRLAFSHSVTHAGTADLPVHVRVTQADGHQAWSSPIYLIA
ncbi:MAG: hypothetical protein ABS99_02715 [Acetobacteraceae bacterium SCN 69-10]|nr:DUF3604 domain-containing protein [Rhodospirillales bacterium]ODU60796.1 MAG: hypothetical protein ABS99_02715 [Acetobacteraceae bacterium SCN 69-10]OJY64941.1 MAG: hypothetical protein BGP12_04215 [Rhodospirillales bacterium 70-18]